jgi:hypothetical protein
MLDDIRIAQPDWNVEIVIINPSTRAQYASLAASATVLPWLQDTAEQDVWSRWGRTKDEFCVVDTQGSLLTVTNLGYASLEHGENRDAVRKVLLTAAEAADLDGDDLPDLWELHFFAGLATQAGDDDDHDGQDTLAEFAFGTDPGKKQRHPPMGTPSRLATIPPRLIIPYRRRAGSLIDYRLETSSDLLKWQPAESPFVGQSPAANLYDGTGMAQARAVVRLDPSLGPVRFLRLRAKPRE